MPVQIFQFTTNNFDECKIDSNELLDSVQFAVSAPYSASYQIAKKSANGQPYFDDAILTAQPGQGGFESRIYGIRFKSFDPAHPTTVLCKAFFTDDPVPTGDLASTSTFNSGGQVSPGGSSVQVQKNGVLVGTEPILDFTDDATLLWTLADDVPGTRITIDPKVKPGGIFGSGLAGEAVNAAAYIMMGFGAAGWRIIPVRTGNIMTSFISGFTSPGGGNLRFVFGTGVAPANGAAFTGSDLIVPIVCAPGSPVSFTTVQTLAIGTNYWFDIAMAGNGVNPNTLASPTVFAAEL